MTSNKSLILILILFFVSAAVLSSFTEKKTAYDTIKNDITKKYIKDLNHFAIASDKLYQTSLKYTGSEKDTKLLRTQLQKARSHYKRAEFLAEYLDLEFCKDFLNGAPLPKLERNAGNPVIVAPKGLQILEELIYSDSLDVREVTAQTRILRDKSLEFFNMQKSVTIEHRQILEASRAELIRVYTLSLTGFDTPGSGKALEDVYTTLSTLEERLKHYFQKTKEKNQDLSKVSSMTFKNAMEYLKENNDFDSFDRLFFLKEYINPIYSQLLKIHQILEIETRDEVMAFKDPVNYYSENLFDEDFLDPFYFTSLNEKVYTKELTDLGKTLFFDPALSLNNKRSCASCHNPAKAFTDGKSKSLAFDFKGTVDRNSPTLVNAIFADRYFHDMRAFRLEDQVEHVMLSEKEFNFNFLEASQKLNGSEDYKKLFQLSFPWYDGEKISRETITLALSAYVQSLVALNSPFDKYVRGESHQIEASTMRGYNLFMGKAACGTCHFAPTFSGLIPPQYKENESEVLGVPLSKDTINPEIDPDMGRSHNKRLMEKSEIFNHSFKTPTIRNIELTAPYMHNGVFSTLEEVLDFYNRGGGHGLGLDVPNQTLPGDKLNLTRQEMSDIISFMKALTDTSNITGRPVNLPSFPSEKGADIRIVGGEY